MQCMGSNTAALLIALSHPDFITENGERVLRTPLASPLDSNEFLPYHRGTPTCPLLPLGDELIHRARLNATAVETQFLKVFDYSEVPQFFLGNLSMGLAPLPENFIFDEWAVHGWLTYTKFNEDWTKAKDELCRLVTKYVMSPTLMPERTPFELHYLSNLISACSCIKADMTFHPADPCIVLHHVQRTLVELGVLGYMDFATGTFHERRYGHVLALGGMPGGLFVDKVPGAGGPVDLMCRVSLRRIAANFNTPLNPYDAIPR